MQSDDIRSQTGRWLVRVIGLLVLAAAPAAAAPFDISEAYEACLDHPDYALGGAMAGDCMMDQSDALDLDIETVLARVEKNYCRAADRDAIAASQSAWLNYRESYCTLIENSPGNTGAWINAGACRLDLTQKRLESLMFLTDHAYSWCRHMQLVRHASHFGDPEGVTRSDDKGDFAWTASKNGDGRFLEISIGPDERQEVIDISACSYCSSGKDCNDGVFVFAIETDQGDVSHAIAHLCTMENAGPRLEILSSLPADAPARATFSANGHVGWIIEEGQLRITVDADGRTAWPSWPDE